MALRDLVYEIVKTGADVPSVLRRVLDPGTYSRLATEYIRETGLGDAYMAGAVGAPLPPGVPPPGVPPPAPGQRPSAPGLPLDVIRGRAIAKRMETPRLKPIGLEDPGDSVYPIKYSIGAGQPLGAYSPSMGASERLLRISPETRFGRPTGRAGTLSVMVPNEYSQLGELERQLKLESKGADVAEARQRRKIAEMPPERIAEIQKGSRPEVILFRAAEEAFMQEAQSKLRALIRRSAAEGRPLTPEQIEAAREKFSAEASARVAEYLLAQASRERSPYGVP